MKQLIMITLLAFAVVCGNAQVPIKAPTKPTRTAAPAKPKPTKPAAKPTKHSARPTRGHNVANTPQEEPATPTVVTPQYPEESVTEGEVIDLGLSTKWASHNVGATKPEEFGGHYGWGDPTGNKTSMDYNDYPTSTPPQDICGTIYDAAQIAMGSGWCMPTKDDWTELIDNCTTKTITLHGVKGIKYTSKKNENSIFIPLAGLRSGTEITDEGVSGHYWTGELDADNNYKAFAWNPEGYSTYTAAYSTARREGLSVRAIRDGINTELAVDLGLSVKWASHNVGADSPEEYGGHYGWADPTGLKTSTNKKDYPSKNPPSNISGTEYDIAHVKWGEG